MALCRITIVGIQNTLLSSIYFLIALCFTGTAIKFQATINVRTGNTPHLFNRS